MTLDVQVGVGYVIFNRTDVREFWDNASFQALLVKRKDREESRDKTNCRKDKTNDCEHFKPA